MSDFPETIRTLKILQDLTEPGQQMPYKFSHLRSLKYLVIVDIFLAPQLKKQIVRFAHDADLRMLCLLKGTPRQGYQKTTNRLCRMEAIYLHEFPQLERHYLVYKRRQLQITLLHRKPQLRRCLWAKQIANFANCDMEHQI